MGYGRNEAGQHICVEEGIKCMSIRAKRNAEMRGVPGDRRPGCWHMFRAVRLLGMLLTLKSVDMSPLPEKAISRSPSSHGARRPWVSLSLALLRVDLQGRLWVCEGRSVLCPPPPHRPLLFFQHCTATGHGSSSRKKKSGFGTIHCYSTHRSLYCCA